MEQVTHLPSWQDDDLEVASSSSAEADFSEQAIIKFSNDFVELVKDMQYMTDDDINVATDVRVKMWKRATKEGSREYNQIVSMLEKRAGITDPDLLREMLDPRIDQRNLIFTSSESEFQRYPRMKSVTESQLTREGSRYFLQESDTESNGEESKLNSKSTHGNIMVGNSRGIGCCYMCYRCCTCKMYKSLEDEERFLLDILAILAEEEGYSALSKFDILQGLVLGRRLRGAEKRYQARESHVDVDELNLPGVAGNALPSRAELEEMEYCFRFANAAYGRYLNPRHALVWGELRTLSRLTHVPMEDIVHFQPTASPTHPANFVAIDHKNQKVVVGVRGTLSIGDTLTDLFACLDPVILERFRQEDVPENERRLLAGVAHAGQRRGARNLFMEIEPIVIDALEKNPTYALRVTGHSLGGGVAAILTMLFRLMSKCCRGRDVRGFTFGCPSTLTEELAEYCKGFVCSVVNKNDIIPRLTISALRWFLNVAKYAGEMKWKDRMRYALGLVPDDELMDTANIVRNLVKEKSPEANSLYVPGKIFYIVKRPRTSWFRTRQIDVILADRKKIRGVEFSAGFFVNHWPVSYRKSLLKIKRDVLKEPIDTSDLMLEDMFDLEPRRQRSMRKSVSRKSRAEEPPEV